jgi:hypothetical protein
MTETPEKIFENHICAYLEKQHKYNHRGQTNTDL